MAQGGDIALDMAGHRFTFSGRSSDAIPMPFLIRSACLTDYLEPMGDVVIFKSGMLADRSSPGRQAIELTVGVTHRLIRQLFGGAWRSRPVWFSHGPPADPATHLRLFGPWVEFGQDCNGILLEAGDLDAPLPASDPAMARHVKQYLDPLLAEKWPAECLLRVTGGKTPSEDIFSALPRVADIDRACSYL